LQAESALLERARELLETAPRRALQHTELHRAQFRHPMLGLERDLLEMDALCRLGDIARATRLGNLLVANQPQGMYAARAHAILNRARAKEAKTAEKDPSDPSNH
jgi:hypothetical protein